jgi:hypothetical protein
MISVVNLTQYGYGMRDCGHRRRKCATRESQWFSHIRLPPDSLRALAVVRTSDLSLRSSILSIPHRGVELLPITAILGGMGALPARYRRWADGFAFSARVGVGVSGLEITDAQNCCDRLYRRSPASGTIRAKGIRGWPTVRSSGPTGHGTRLLAVR